jgi:glycosyltransferase involved in cell wall biosynthesis
MRITIDATSLLLRSAGIKSYTYHWIRQLRAQAGPDSIGAFPFLSRWGSLNHDRSVLGPLPTYARLAVLYAVNQFGNPLIDWAAGPCDIFHASNQVRHVPRGAKLTATIHDLTCWVMPQFHTAANVEADKRFAREVLTKADGLIAVSEYTRQDAIQYLGIPPERIVTIHSGVPAAYFDAQPNGVPRRYGLDKPYVLFVGTIEPRKNLDRLMDAWQGLPSELANAFDLVIAGPAGWAPAATRARLLAKREGVRHLGYVPEADLPALTAGAVMFAYPSLYEGFGFPVAQAMAAGIPVLTSNVSALPEVAGDGALLVDPLSVEQIRTALKKLLTSPDLRRQLSRRGRQQAERFRWETCAARSLEFFRRLLE